MSGKDFFYRTTSKKFNLYICESCSIERIWPIPKSDEIDSFYPKTYYSFNMKENAFTKVKRVMAEYYYKRSLTLVIAWFFNQLLFLGLLLKNRNNNNFLDIGCGDGHDVELMKKYGWNAYGFEIGEKKDNFQSSIFFRNSIEDLSLENIKFDYIRIWQVLEHVGEPDVFLHKIRQLLSEKGQVIIGIPNTNGLWAKIFGQFWFGRDVPRHLFNYNNKNIKLILEKHNFKVVKIKYQSFNGLIGSIQNLVTGISGKHIEIYNKLLLVVLFYPFEFLCNLLNISDAIVVIAEKQ